MTNIDIFMIQLTKEEWTPIEAVYVERKDRTELSMQPGWGDTILSVIRRDYHPIPCAFTYQKQQFFKRKGFPWFIFMGECKECQNIIQGACRNKPVEGQGVAIWIKTKNTVGIFHSNRRRLANIRRKVIKEKLLHVQPTLHKHLNAAKALNNSGTASPFHHSTPVLRVARQEARDEDLNLKEYPGPPLDSLLLIMLKKSAYVRKVSTDPVIVWYWSELQTSLNNQVSNQHLSISIDAAGRFVLPVEIIKGHFSPAIFLYNICVKINHKIFFLTQMLSSKHDTETILLWLLAWIESGASPPYEAVADCSKALLNALCLAFNKCYYSDYLDNCLSLITNESTTKPTTLVKRDRNHLIKAVTRWKVFHSTKINVEIKEFYCRAIAYCLEITELKMMKKVILALFILCQSEGIDSQSLCQKYLNYIDDKIGSFSYIEKEEAEGGKEPKKEPDELKFSKISKFINEIKSESMELLKAESINFTEANPYYLPLLLENLEALFIEFPAWSSVMHPFYQHKTSNVSTSSASEVGYRIMRSNYNMSKVVTINRFLLEHLRILDGATKEGLFQMKEFLKKKDAPDMQFTVNEDDILMVENELIMDNDDFLMDDVDSIMDDVDSIMDDVDLMIDNDNWTSGDIVKNDYLQIINGNGTKTPIDFEGRQVRFLNTCAFDSIFELLVHSAILHSNTVAQYFEKHQSNNVLFKLAQEYLNKNLTYEEFQKYRAALIHPLLSITERNNLVEFNCEANVNSLFRLLLGSTAGSVNLIACEDCRTSINEAGRPLIVEDSTVEKFSDTVNLSTKDIISLCVQSVFESTELTCRSCHSSAEKTLYSVHSFIIIDIESLFLRADFFCDTSDIPLILTYSNYTLQLTGIIAYQPNHYVSYLYSALNDTWELKDDTKNIQDIRKKFSRIKINVLVYCKK